MDIKLPLNANLQLAINKATDAGFNLQLNQVVKAKVIETQITLDALTLKISDQTLSAQAKLPITVQPGQTLQLQVVKLLPTPELKVITPSLPGRPPPVSAQTSDIQILTLVSPSSPANKPAPNPLAQLASGQQLQATIVAVNGDKLTLQLQPTGSSVQNTEPMFVTLNVKQLVFTSESILAPDSQKPASTLGVADNPKPAPSTLVITDSQKPAPSTLAVTDSQKPAPSTLAITDSQKPAPSTLAATDSQKPAPSTLAVTDSQKPAPSTLAVTESQKPAPSTLAVTDSQKPAPSTLVVTDSQKPAPSTLAVADNPKLSPFLLTVAGSPKPLTSNLPVTDNPKLIPATLKEGDQVAVQLLKTGDTPRFALTTLATDQQRITETFKQLLPIHASPAPLLNQLQLAMPQLHADATVSETLKNLAQEILQNIPSSALLSDPAQLKQAVSQSGLFLERKLVELLMDKPDVSLNNDFKLKLGKLIQLLTQELAHQSQNKATDNIEILKESLQKAQSALAKLTLDQINSLPKEETIKQGWTLELPFFHNQSADSVQIQIERDSRGNGNDPQKNWAVNITITPPDLATIHCKISCYDGSVNTRFWSEAADTVDKINAHLDYLKQQFEKNGLTTGFMEAHQGQPAQTDSLKTPISNLLHEKV